MREHLWVNPELHSLLPYNARKDDSGNIVRSKDHTVMLFADCCYIDLYAQAHFFDHSPHSLYNHICFRQAWLSRNPFSWRVKNPTIVKNTNTLTERATLFDIFIQLKKLVVDLIRSMIMVNYNYLKGMHL